MKRFLLPVLSWALAVCPIFAQNTLPPSIQSYAVNWSYAVKQMFKASGYDVPGPHAEFELTSPVETRSTDVVLDSTVSFGYGSPEDSLPLLRNVYTYPQPDKQVIVESFYNNDHWETMARTTLTTDVLGRMVETYAEQFDVNTGAYLPDSRIELYPHEDSDDLVDSFFVFGWSVELQEWVRLLATWNMYDQSQKLVESTSSIEIFDMPLVFIDRYAYNPDGENIRIDSYTVIEGEEMLTGRQELWYEDHFLTSVTTLVSEGPQGMITESKIDYSYTHEGLKELVESFDYDTEKQDWKLVKIEAYAYDDQQNLAVEEIHVEDENGLWLRSMTSWSYRAEGAPSVESGFYYDNNIESWVLEDTKYYYYSDLTAVDPDPVVADALFLYPNPSSGAVQVKLPGKVSVHVYTLSGQFVQKYYLAPGEKILDFSFLPAGIYQVLAKSDEDYFSGKMIIQ